MAEDGGTLVPGPNGDAHFRGAASLGPRARKIGHLPGCILAAWGSIRSPKSRQLPNVRKKLGMFGPLDAVGENEALASGAGLPLEDASPGDASLPAPPSIPCLPDGDTMGQGKVQVAAYS